MLPTVNEIQHKRIVMGGSSSLAETHHALVLGLGKDSKYQSSRYVCAGSHQICWYQRNGDTSCHTICTTVVSSVAESQHNHISMTGGTNSVAEI